MRNYKDILLSVRGEKKENNLAEITIESSVIKMIGWRKLK